MLIYLNLLFSGLICLAVLTLFILLYAQKNRLDNLSAQCERIKRDLRGICAGTTGVGQRLLCLEQTIKNVSSRQTKVEQREPELASYSHATKLIEMGANIDEIIQSCGLTRAEAELLLVMYQKEEKDHKDLSIKPLKSPYYTMPTTKA